jgi:hypothetical protein
MAWDQNELSVFVEGIAEGTKWSTMYRAYARLLHEDNCTGALLLAGGHSQLADRGIGVVHKTTSVVKLHARAIFDAIQELQTRLEQPDAATSYWERMGEGTQHEQDVVREFSHPNRVGQTLQAALCPLPASSVRYTIIHMPTSKLDVASCHRRIASRCNKSACAFKVVSVASSDARDCICKNFIYYREKRKWLPLASVDFEQHGAAPPGHWHLNRGPHGDKVEHWGVDLHNIFHGDPMHCPLWWLFIPRSKHYANLPQRVAHLVAPLAI